MFRKEKMGTHGYAFLHHSLRLTAIEPPRPARTAPVTRVTPSAGELLIPRHVAPESSDPLTHLLFALKHEGIDLPILAQALRAVPAANIVAAVRAAPSSGYARIVGYLWEAFNDRLLQGLPVISGPTVDLFDTRRYVTGPATRDAKWRVNFNGLGSLAYCATVERTPEIEALLALDILARADEFLLRLDPTAAERAMAWAYLHETENSFAIEREKPSAKKAEAFVELLKQAHRAEPLGEDKLVALQNVAITNPLDQAVSYRQAQNWLRGPLRGASGVTYVPPPPGWVNPLMDGLLVFANSTPRQIDPLIAAAIASFGFVFIHPFMDGNGRLSRFLFHHALCRSGRLSDGRLLPVSVAMKRNEAEYLDVLQQFSRPARRRWDVEWIGDDDYRFHFRSDDTLYRYWDATRCVEFGLRMARQALEQDLQQETEFLARFDRAFKAVDARFDVRGNDLTTLVVGCLQNNGQVSAWRRKQYQLTVPPAVFDAIEEACGEAAIR
jgi:hypothetical protein